MDSRLCKILHLLLTEVLNIANYIAHSKTRADVWVQVLDTFMFTIILF